MAGAGKGDFRSRFAMRPSAQELERAFGEAGAEMSDLRFSPRTVARMTNIMRAGLVGNLQGRGSPIGYTWPRGNARYLRRKEKAGLGRQPLVARGSLMGQILTGPARTSRRSVSVGVRGKRFGYVAAIQFKLGYWFVSWTDAMRNGIVAALHARAQDLLDRVAQRVRS